MSLKAIYLPLSTIVDCFCSTVFWLFTLEETSGFGAPTMQEKPEWEIWIVFVPVKA